MLRITLHKKPEGTSMQLERKIIGPWVNAFDQAWLSLAESLGSKKRCIDLREVVQMDAGERRVPSDIRKSTGADFLADTPLTKSFAEEALWQHQEAIQEEQ
jgi:hypothetical protein